MKHKIQISMSDYNKLCDIAIKKGKPVADTLMDLLEIASKHAIIVKKGIKKAIIKKMLYRKSWYLTHPWEVVVEIATSVKRFIQRGSRGFADCDVWNLDYYLSSWLPKALRELKNGESYPSYYPLEYNGMTEKKWHTILEQMAQGFESMDEIPMKDWVKEDKKRRLKRRLFAFWFWNLWD